jgi:hypothetical protein
MPPIPFADNFLAGSIISLLLPVGLLIAVTIWYWVAVRRIPEESEAPKPGKGAGEPAAGATPAAETPPRNPGANP